MSSARDVIAAAEDIEDGHRVPLGRGLADIVLEALTAAGFAVVPRHATVEMTRAGMAQLCDALECTCDEDRIWHAMVKAATGTDGTEVRS